MNERIQAPSEPQGVEALLEKVKRGEELSTSERLLAVELLEERGALSAPALAKLLGVSERCIRKDRARLRKIHADLARHFNIFGELFRQYRIHLAIIDNRLSDGTLSERERILYLRERRETILAFLERLTAIRLEDALRKIGAVNGNLSSVTQVSAN